MKKKDYTVTIIVVVGLFVLTLMLNVAVSPSHPQVRPMERMMQIMTETEPSAYDGRAEVKVIDQKVVRTVTVLSAALKSEGYVVIHKEEKGEVGEIIAVSNVLEPGLYTNLSIDIAEGVEPGKTLIAMIHHEEKINGEDMIINPDDDDIDFSDEPIFDPTEDTMITDDSGMVVMDKFMTM